MASLQLQQHASSRASTCQGFSYSYAHIVKAITVNIEGATQFS